MRARVQRLKSEPNRRTRVERIALGLSQRLSAALRFLRGTFANAPTARTE